MQTDMRCIAVDDEPLALKLIESYILKTPSLRLCAGFGNASDAFEYLKKNQTDLLFLDIHMPGMNGIQLATLIDTYRTKVVFTTAFDSYALDGFKVDATDYLLKPISFSDFSRSVEKVIRLTAPDTAGTVTGHLAVRSEYRLMKIDYNDILFLESLRDYVSIELVNGQKIRTLSTLKGLESVLPRSLFLRVHRSFIVNINKVDNLHRSGIKFGKSNVPVSDTYRAELLEKIHLK